LKTALTYPSAGECSMRALVFPRTLGVRSLTLAPTRRLSNAAPAPSASASAFTAVAAAHPCCSHTKRRFTTQTQADVSAQHHPVASAPSSTTPSSSLPSASTFPSLGLRSAFLQRRLQQLGLRQPTEIQHKSIPLLLSGKNVLMGAETGCGKTLAYLLPVLDSLLHDAESEQVNPHTGQVLHGQPDDRSHTLSPLIHPRVIILQPNRELCNQLESVLTSLIGPSGELALPVHVTAADEQAKPHVRHVRIHYASLIGTQIYPIQGHDRLDILITTPTCLAHNIPLHDLYRARARRRKQLAKWNAHAGADAAASAFQFVPPPSTSSPSTSPHSRFDLVDFVCAHRMIILDEVDSLLEGGSVEKLTKAWIEEVWMGRKMRKQKRRKGGKAEWLREEYGNRGVSDYDINGEVTSSNTRQFIFVGATLANISPLTTFQYLLHTFTPEHDHVTLLSAVSNARHSSTAPSLQSLPDSTNLTPVLSSHFHHIRPELLREDEVVVWKRVGPKTQKELEDGVEGDGMIVLPDGTRIDARAWRERQKGDVEKQEHDPHAPPSLDELDQRVAESRGEVVRGPSLTTKKRRQPFGARPSVPSASNTIRSLIALPTDREKVEATIQFLNKHTPMPNDASINHPPAKSLLFVESGRRLKMLLDELNRLQATPASASNHAASSSSSHSSSSLPRLSPHIRLIPYYADLKPSERTNSMKLFNSSLSAKLVTEHECQLEVEGRSMQSSLTVQDLKQRLVTHQVLVCTSLVARGLDFNAIVAPPTALHPSAASPSPSSASSISDSLVRAGFTSLIQFDLAKNVIEYIHRVGRMFRYRPQHNSTVTQRKDENERRQDAATDIEPNSAEGSSQPIARVLNLYTATDDLLVSHIRHASSSSGPLTSLVSPLDTDNDTDTQSSSASASASVSPSTLTSTSTSSQPSASHLEPIGHDSRSSIEGNIGNGSVHVTPPMTLIPDAAFSRNRRLRHRAKKEAKERQRHQQQQYE